MKPSHGHGYDPATLGRLWRLRVDYLAGRRDFLGCLPPLLRAVIEDVICCDGSVTEFEARHNLPQRSAKALVRAALEVMDHTPDSGDGIDMGYRRDAIHYLSGTGHDPDPRLTALQNRFVNRLKAARGSVVSREKMIAAMYFDRDEPENPESALDVYACDIRKRAPDLSPVAVRGVGFKLPPSENGQRQTR